jgi:hypothetical protein
MISQITVMMHQIGQRTYHLMCAPDSPLVDLKDALIQFAKMVADIEKAAQDKAKIEVEEPKQESSDVVQPSK